MRCLKLSDISEIFVVTNEAQKFFVSGQVEEMGLDEPIKNILIEPQGKNTLPAICYGMIEIKKRFGKCSAAVFPSDHILDMKAMEKIKSAEELCSKYLVTFGITPSSPHTGYGYIKPGENLEIGSKVLEFREKPGLEAAKKYIQEKCLWNSGMFMFDTGFFFKELKKHAPEITAAFTQKDKNIEEIYKELPSISID